MQEVAQRIQGLVNSGIKIRKVELDPVNFAMKFDHGRNRYRVDALGNVQSVVNGRLTTDKNSQRLAKKIAA